MGTEVLGFAQKKPAILFFRGILFDVKTALGLAWLTVISYVPSSYFLKAMLTILILSKSSLSNFSFEKEMVTYQCNVRKKLEYNYQKPKRVSRKY